MSKRKRDDKDISPGSDDEIGRQRFRVQAKLEKGRKSISGALKLAAGFERQKHSRRKKAATENHDRVTLARLEDEYHVLKSLDWDIVANHHLRKTLLKIKSIANHSSLPPLSAGSQIPADKATLNVTARLYKTSHVKNALDAIIDDVKNILVRSTVSSASLNKETGREERLDLGKGRLRLSESDHSGLVVGATVIGEEILSGDDTFDGFDDSDSRMASLSDDDINPKPDKDGRELSSFRVRDDPELNDQFLSENYSTASSEAEVKTDQTKNKRLANSTFLPALTNGGYWSGSESEPEDDIDAAPRKNRRGQRARQQLWEKKYGSKAKHLQNPTIESRDSGWDPKKGARLDDDDSRRGGFGNRRGYEANSKSGRVVGRAEESSEISKPPKRDDSGPLHPSWEAAKRAKELKQTPQFQGKKVTFD